MPCVATQERNGLVNWDKVLIPMADTWLVTGLCRKQHFSGCRDFSLCTKQATTLPPKKAFFCKGILKYLNLSGKSLLMDPCHSKNGQKSAPAWSSWHINVRFYDIVYLYFKTINIYMAINSAIKGNWKHRTAHLTTLTQDANYRFSEDDSGKQSINVLKNECHSW